MGRDPLFMLDSALFCIVIGTVLGFLSGLGIGGGSLLIVWLTVILGMDPQTAKLINLMFYLPAAAISCILRSKSGDLNWIKPLPAIIAGCAGAIVGTYYSNVVQTTQLKGAFGIILLAIGVKELFYRPRKAR